MLVVVVVVVVVLIIIVNMPWMYTKAMSMHQVFNPMRITQEVGHIKRPPGSLHWRHIATEARFKDRINGKVG